MKDFISGKKYKDIEGLKDVFEYFGKGKPLSDVQIIFIIGRWDKKNVWEKKERLE